MIVSAQHKVVGAPVRPELLGLFPSVPVVTFKGNDLILLPHDYPVTRLLRNMGMPVPAPIITQYDWEGGKPFEVQKATAAMLTTNQRAYVLNGMGTGKTKAALWSWKFLNKTGEANKALVVAPLSTLHFVWAREIIATISDMKVHVLHGSREKRLKLLDDTSADIYLINHDGLSIIAEALKKRKDIDTLILDELAAYRNGGADRTKITRKVASRFKWVWGMTGSPTPNAPTDAWGQCSIVTPATTPEYYRHFRDAVMSKVTNFKYVPKREAVDIVHALMQPAVRFTLDDVVELPDLVERQVDVDLGKEQKRIYTALEQNASVGVAGGTITAVHAGAVLIKLLQVSCGWVYREDRSVVALDNKARLEALVEFIEAATHKVIVFVPFKHALAGIEKHLATTKLDVAPPISGDTSAGERSRIFGVFQNTDKYRVIIAHPQCMSHGVTLTAADTIIWFSPTSDLEIFDQANARIRRYGQRHKQQIIMFQTTKVEQHLYRRLRAKQKTQNLLLELFASNT